MHVDSPAPSTPDWPPIKADLDDAGNPRWRVDCRFMVDGQTFGRRRICGSEAEAREIARQARVLRTNEQTRTESLSTVDLTDYRVAKRILEPFGVSLLEAAQFFAEKKGRLLELQTKSVAEVREEFISNPRKRGRGREGKLHTKNMRLHLERFGLEFDATAVSEIETMEIGDWLAELTVTKLNSKRFGHLVADATRVNYRNTLSCFFSFAIARGYAEGPNPVTATTLPETYWGEVGILTVDEARDLLEASTDPEARRYHAIGLFAGLRRSEILRLVPSDIDLEDRLICVQGRPGQKQNAGDRYVKMSDNLVAWLERDPLPLDGRPVRPLFPHPYRLYDLHLEARDRAGLLTDWPKNALRHSYASYHLAEHENAAALALEMGHTSANMIFRHYRRKVKPAPAADYWQLLPG